MTAAVVRLGRQALLGGVAALLAGLVLVLIASVQGMIEEPGSSLADGYWIGRLPLMGLGALLVTIGGTVASIGGLVVALVRGGGSRLLAIALGAPVAFWWVIALTLGGVRCRPEAACSSNGPDVIAYSLPEQTLGILVIPALLIALVVWAPRRPARLVAG